MDIHRGRLALDQSRFVVLNRLGSLDLNRVVLLGCRVSLMLGSWGWSVVSGFRLDVSGWSRVRLLN